MKTILKDIPCNILTKIKLLVEVLTVHNARAQCFNNNKLSNILQLNGENIPNYYLSRLDICLHSFIMACLDKNSITYLHSTEPTFNLPPNYILKSTNLFYLNYYILILQYNSNTPIYRQSASIDKLFNGT